MTATRMTAIAASALVLAVGVATPARADGGDDLDGRGSPATGSAADGPRDVVDDANAGHVATMPTALTAPAGAWLFEDDDGLLVKLVYGVTSDLQVTAIALVPIETGQYFGALSAKLQIARAGRARIALQAAAAGIRDRYDQPHESARFGELAGVATICIDHACASHLDATVATGIFAQHGVFAPLAFAAGGVVGVLPHVKLVAELDTAAFAGGDISGVASGTGIAYGLRFTSRQLAADVVLVRPFCSGNGECADTLFPAGFPLLALSYRGVD